MGVGHTVEAGIVGDVSAACVDHDLVHLSFHVGV